MPVTASVRFCSGLVNRPAPKNQIRSRRIGPPRVLSYTGVTLLTVWSSGKGVSERHASLLSVVRNDPLNVFPPDLVIALTTPPPNRPYSAEIAPVDTFVSWIASSMNRLSAWPRRFSLTTTPLTRYWLSNERAPDIMMLPLGPLPATPGASSTASFTARPTGSRSIAAFLKFEATVAAWTISPLVPVTVTVSWMLAIFSTISTVWVSAIVTEMLLRFRLWNPWRSNVTA